jgi:hypothetical protein
MWKIFDKYIELDIKCTKWHNKWQHSIYNKYLTAFALLLMSIFAILYDKDENTYFNFTRLVIYYGLGTIYSIVLIVIEIYNIRKNKSTSKLGSYSFISVCCIFLLATAYLFLYRIN